MSKEELDKNLLNLRNLTFKKIETKQELVSVILFLKKGYQWSSYYSKELANKIYILNKELDFFGYFLIDENKKIYIAMLFYFQGKIKVNKEFISIINFSALYATNKARGVLSTYFFKKLIKQNSQFILTDCTPSTSIQRFLLKNGFLKTNNFNFSLSIFYLFPNLFKDLSILKIRFKNDVDYQFKTPPNEFFLGECIQEKLEVNKSKLTILINKSFKEKKIKNLTIRFKAIKIIWTSDNLLFSSNFYQIMFLLFLKNNCLFATTHVNLTNIVKSVKDKAHHFYLAPKDIKFDQIAIGSELCY
ncbi:hypothetical protein [Prochlorococcus marinus]|uniref:hypothetical protein n=1 Tax=Prochlorococcus marinus TaxID=1219 RepID=UPI001ADC446E|nr:hypothetical protein [Prochlorococcus marinus]MBO8204968.1 hypothetical protein [Prochlorococcus marinus CUG1415]MBW3044241.1 hypothetical protein [Prochlorococcus marinus str. MU1415]